MSKPKSTAMPPEVAVFVARWGEVGRAWGMPRTAAQIHGLLLSASDPLSADDIVDALGVARSNVSTSLKELRALGVVRTASAIGERKELFEALGDPWEAAANIAAARKAREFDPALAALADAAETIGGKAGERLADYSSFAGRAGEWMEDLATIGKGPMKQVMKMGAAIATIAPAKEKSGKKKKKKG